MENNKISFGQRGGKKVDFASFLPTKQQKNKPENALPAAIKKPQKVRFEII